MKHIILAALLAPADANAAAPVIVKDAWVRTSVSQEKVTGALMHLTASEKARLADVRPPIAGVAELHEISLDNDAMRMRQLSGIDLPASAPF